MGWCTYTRYKNGESSSKLKNYSLDLFVPCYLLLHFFFLHAAPFCSRPFFCLHYCMSKCKSFVKTAFQVECIIWNSSVRAENMDCHGQRLHLSVRYQNERGEELHFFSNKCIMENILWCSFHALYKLQRTICIDPGDTPILSLSIISYNCPHGALDES